MDIANAVAQILTHTGFGPVRLASFAIAGHGFMGDEGFYGVTYPSDLDDWQREREGACIPEGFVEVTFEREDFLVPTAEYLRVLAQHLRNLGLHELADSVPAQ